MEDSFLKKNLLFSTVAAVIIGLTAPAIVNAAGVPPVTAAEARFFTDAQTHYKKGEYSEAMKALAKYVDMPRPHPFAVTIYGLSALSLHKTKTAVSVFEKGAEVWEDDPSMHQNLGVALMSAENPLKAGEHFEKAAGLVKKSTEKAMLRRSAAAAYYQGKAFSRVRPVLGELAQANSFDAEALKLAGGADLQLKNWASAETAFLRIRDLEPEKRAVWQTLASVKLMRGKRADAAPSVEISAFLAEREAKNAKLSRKLRKDAEETARSLRKGAADLYALTKSPVLELSSLEKLSLEAFADGGKKRLSKQRSEIARLERLLSARIRSGARRQALETLDELLRIAPTPARHTLKGSLLYQMGRLEASHRAYSADHSKGPEGDKNRFFAALTAWEMGDRTTAKKGFLTVSEKSPLRTQAEAAVRSIDEADALEASLSMTDVDAVKLTL